MNGQQQSQPSMRHILIWCGYTYKTAFGILLMLLTVLANIENVQRDGLQSYQTYKTSATGTLPH